MKNMEAKVSSLRHLLILCISCVKSLWTTYGDFRLSDTSFADTELRKTGAISTLTKPILVGIYFRFYVYVYPFFSFQIYSFKSEPIRELLWDLIDFFKCLSTFFPQKTGYSGLPI